MTDEQANTMAAPAPDGRPPVAETITVASRGAGWQQGQTQPLAAQPHDPDEAEALRALEALGEKRKQKKHKRLIAIAVACGVLLLLIGSCAAASMMAIPSALEEMKPQTAAVERGDLSSTVQATGNLKAGSQVAVTPEVSGIIQEVMVGEGQHVEAGDVLFTLKNTDLEKALDDARSNVDKAARGVDTANAEVARANDTYHNAIDTFNRAVDAYEKQVRQAQEDAEKAYDKAYKAAVAAIPATATAAERAAAQAEAEQAAEAAAAQAGASAAAVDPGAFDHSGYLSAIDAAQASADSAADALADARRAYDYAVQEADKRTVRAAASGTVLALAATPGAAVGGAAGGTSTASGPLAQIADLSTISVDIEVNEIDVSEVRAGQAAQVSFTAIPDLELPARVETVASVASGASGDSPAAAGGSGVVTFTVTAVIDQPDERLRPGMSATVKIVTKELADVLLVPSAAVSGEGETAFVSVPAGEDGFQTEVREVTVAGRTTSQVAISSGLEEGDLVVVSNPMADLAAGQVAGA